MGGPGNDFINGGAGDDLLYGQADNDSILYLVWVATT
ncbi:MAG: hypothetical protein U5P41_02060 [Gammaproteobacteria bacterium]|nr:hypothetical protein [Gammaproteobacteria bacterium]